MEENLQRLPDEKLAQRPSGEQFNKRYIRNAPRIWFDPRFDATPLFGRSRVERGHVQLRVGPNF
jgi:hypothetical protein